MTLIRFSVTVFQELSSFTFTVHSLEVWFPDVSGFHRFHQNLMQSEPRFLQELLHSCISGFPGTGIFPLKPVWITELLDSTSLAH